MTSERYAPKSSIACIYCREKKIRCEASHTSVLWFSASADASVFAQVVEGFLVRNAS